MNGSLRLYAFFTITYLLYDIHYNRYPTVYLFRFEAELWHTRGRGWNEVYIDTNRLVEMLRIFRNFQSSNRPISTSPLHIRMMIWVIVVRSMVFTMNTFAFSIIFCTLWETIIRKYSRSEITEWLQLEIS